MIWRVRHRRTFDALRAKGKRVGGGPLSIVHLGPDPGVDGQPPQVAFAIGKRVGNAVERNRIRRRLRSIARELANEGAVPEGAMLVIVRPEVREMSYTAIREAFSRALGRLGGERQR